MIHRDFVLNQRYIFTVDAPVVILEKLVCYRRRARGAYVGLGSICLRLFLFVQTMDDWSFDAFSVNESADGHAIKYVGYELLQRYDLISKYKVTSALLASQTLAMYQVNSNFTLIHNIANAVHGRCAFQGFVDRIAVFKTGARNGY